MNVCWHREFVQDSLSANTVVLSVFFLKDAKRFLLIFLVPRNWPDNVQALYDGFQREATISWKKIRKLRVDGYRVNNKYIHITVPMVQG